MEISSQLSGNIVIIELKGRIDAHVIPGLSTWATGQPTSMIIDFTEVTFIDSMALGWLVKTMKHCRQQGGELCLCGLQTPVRVIFELTRLNRAFAIAADREAALALLAAGS